MSDPEILSILKRKAGAGRPAAAEPVVARGLGQALARAAQEMMALPLAVLAAGERALALAELPEVLPDRALIALVEGPGERIGLAAWSPEAVASLIEVQTTGLAGGGEVAARRPTRTDAALAAPFLDRALAEAEAAMAGEPAARWFEGVRYASFLADPAPLGLILDDLAYRIVTLRLRLGAGPGREGTFQLILPEAGPVAALTPDEAPEGPWGRELEAAVLAAPAGLEAVLGRITMPLAAVLALRPGDHLPVARAALGQVRVEGRGGRFLAWGRLGQAQGHYALRLMFDSGPAGENGSGPDGGAAARDLLPGAPAPG